MSELLGMALDRVRPQSRTVVKAGRLFCKVTPVLGSQMYQSAKEAYIESSAGIAMVANR